MFLAEHLALLIDRYREQPWDSGEDLKPDRPRLGMSDEQVARGLWPQGDVIVVSHINSGRAASTAARVTQER